jgi:hypothetical protein
MKLPACVRIVAAVLAVALCARGAGAGERDDTAGLWALGAVSVGAGSGTYRYSAMSNPGYGTPRRQLTFQADMHPTLFGLWGVPGYRFTPYTALGVGADTTLLIQSGERLASATLDSGYFASAGFAGELRPLRDGPFLVWYGGWAQSGFTGGRTAEGSATNIVDLEKLTGYALRLTLGWTFGFVGACASVTRAELSARDSQTTFRPTLYTVGAAFQYW